VFRTVGTNGDAEYWATNKLDMTLQQAADYVLDAWQIEVYHRGLKQFTGIKGRQLPLEIAQSNHIGLAICAFVRLEVHRLQRGVSLTLRQKVPLSVLISSSPLLTFNQLRNSY
jgi:hypothetical protein